MKNGRCPKCGSSEVHQALMLGERTGLLISTFSSARVMTCICVSCGYLEEYVLDRDKLAQIAEKWPRVQ